MQFAPRNPDTESGHHIQDGTSRERILFVFPSFLDLFIGGLIGKDEIGVESPEATNREEDNGTIEDQHTRGPESGSFDHLDDGVGKGHERIVIECGFDDPENCECATCDDIEASDSHICEK